MKLLFVHDHPFYKEGSDIYSGGGLPNTIWNNYEIFFSELIVFGRRSQNQKDKKVLSSSSSDNCKFYLTEKYSSISSLLKNYCSISNELYQQIKHVDIVLVRLPSVLGFIAAKLAFKMNKKVWVEQVGNAKEALGSHGSLLGKFAAPFFEYQNKKTVKHADFVSYVTENKLQRDYPAGNHAVTVSLSDVIINFILDLQSLNQDRFFNDILRIGVIGGFDTKYKGQDKLLEAISLLSDDKKKNIKISFVGKGNFQWVNDLAKKLNLYDNIDFIGPLESGEQINNFLKSLSLYVQPSLTEGMPRATLEAMAMGCPVIGSNVGGIPDVVSKKFIHKKGNTVELSNHIEYLYSNRIVLYNEALFSLEKAIPFLKSNLDKKRNYFYHKMNEVLNK